MKKIKAVFIQAHGEIKAGDRMEMERAEFDTLEEAGIVVTAREYEAREEANRVKAAAMDAAKANIIKACDRAVKRKAVTPQGDGENSYEKVKARFMDSLEKGSDPELIVQLIDYIPGENDVALTNRIIRANGEGLPTQDGIQLQGVDPKDAAKAYIKATSPSGKLVREGKWKEAQGCSLEGARYLKAIDENVPFRDMVKGADADPMVIARCYHDNLIKGVAASGDYNDPNTQVGTLSTAVLVMRNLGFLMKKLGFMKFMSTDMRNEPCGFGQTLRSRYVVLPDLLTFVPGVGFTSDATTISNASAGTVQSGVATQTSGTRTPSVPSTPDVDVKIDQFKGVNIEFPVSTLASTPRNLFAENRGASIYKLGDAIASSVLAKAFAATWTGAVPSYTKALANWNVPSLVDLKTAMEVSQIPDVGRFAVMHTFYADKLLQDSSLLSAKAILALINKDASAFEQAELPGLFGIQVFGTQLASATAAGALTSWVDPATLGTTGLVGFAGNASSMVFTARVPQDFVTVAAQLGIPATAAVEIVTEAESGLTVMVFKYVNNATWTISQTICLMWGSAQGDPRVGMVIKPA